MSDRGENACPSQFLVMSIGVLCTMVGHRSLRGENDANELSLGTATFSVGNQMYISKYNLEQIFVRE